ncbi:TatD family hydrolase [Tundrisphaera sp. TA3]|uniref:TatD family hydrolase n=1 Tax=Tundrisphaera sp. TA3 TaxID=3435775 RepID=UPI003EBF67B8
MNADLAWVDTHAHLADPRLRGRLPEVLRSAREAGVTRIVAIGTTAEDSRIVAHLAAEHAGISAAVGIHPNDAAEQGDDAWKTIVAMADRPGVVVALGETGLDRHWDRTPFPVQQDFFGRHLALAADLGLPVVIHARESLPDVIDQLAGLARPVRGVLHSFVGGWEEAETLLALGLHLSFAGMLTFANKTLDPLREVAARAPLDRILVETDSPYLSPHPFRGKPNEPARSAITAIRLAEIRGLRPEDLAEATTANARRLFGLGAETIAPPA